MGDMKIGVVGCAGRMGRMLVRQVHETPGCAVAGGVEPEGHEALGEDLGALAGIAPSVYSQRYAKGIRY